MMELDDEIKQAFFEDSLQMIEGAEAVLMSMDSGDVAKDAIDSLFRMAHNLKGGSMAMGYEDLSHFAHTFEDVLSLLKSGSLQPSKEILNLLFRGIDTIKAFVVGLKQDNNFKQDTSALSGELKEVFASGKSPAVAKPVAAESQMDDATAIALFNEMSAPPSAPVKTEPPKKEKPALASAPPIGKPSQSEDLIRVHTGKLDVLLNLVGELVINQSIMTRHKLEGSTACEQALQTVSYMEKLVNEVQDVAMGLRMTIVKSMFQKLQRTARDIASTQKKEMILLTEGEHVELDRTIIERMGDPLTHLIRNAVDHGIEDAEARKTSGKPGRAEVRLSAQQKDDTVLITVRDDGKGLDAKKLIAKGIEKGLVAAGSVLSDQEAYALIFKPGFSTKEQVTDVSGRGVGMDVVSRAVEDMKGSIFVETVLGKGTAFVISLPLSLSIINGMVVGIGQKKYVIPVAQLVETLEYRKFKVESSTRDGRMINLRGEVIPVFSLERILGSGATSDRAGRLITGPGVVTSSGGRKISFEVDELLGQQQVVIKKLGPKMADLPGIVGGAILSNGEPTLVLNLHDLSETLRRTYAA